MAKLSLTNNIKLPRSKKRIVFLAIFFVALFFIGALLSNTLSKKDDSPHLTIPPVDSDSYIPDQVIVRFREGYIPLQLYEEQTKRMENNKTILGKLTNGLKSTKEVIIQEEPVEQKLKTIQHTLEELGVERYELVSQYKEGALKGFYRLYLKEGSNLVDVQRKISQIPFLASSEPNIIMSIDAIPNDPSFNQLWGMRKIQAPEAWDLHNDSSNIVVAVIDTGADYSHPDLVSNLIPGRDIINNDSDPTDDHFHGTHVTGTIGAVGDNGKGIVGVNWNVKIMPVKVMDATGRGDTLSIVRGIEYAADNGAKVINMSLGAQGGCPSGGVYASAITNAISKGVIVVAAAGNDSRDASTFVPASCTGVITVAATTPSDARAGFSNFGASVSIAAPGAGIYSTIPVARGSYRNLDGTSMASPHVAGAAALLLSANPSLTSQQIRDCLIKNGDPITADAPIGGVRLNVYKALQACANLSGIVLPTSTIPPSPATSIVPTGSLTPTPTLSPTANPTLTPSPATSSPTPTPTPREFFNCYPDPRCVNSGKSIQLCPLICNPV